MSDKLTSKQSAFVEEYCKNGFNATQASISAGYSKKTAKQAGSENLSKPVISEKIEEFKKKAAEKALCDTQWVVKNLMVEAQGMGEDTSSSARVTALKSLSDFTGGFDANKQKVELSNNIHEDWLNNLQ